MKGKACYLSFSLDELIVLDDRQVVKDKKTIITLFLARFTLNEAEAEAPTLRDIPIGQRFFDVMDKTEHIREDCHVLMAGEDGSTKARCVSSFYSTLHPFIHRYLF